MEKKRIYVLGICLLSFACSWCTTADENHPNGAESGYQVSKEIYDSTFDEIYAFIEKIQRIMDNADYDAWKSILTSAYINKYSDPRYLKQISAEPGLKNKGITLSTLKDYFLFVFIPSRTGIKMDKIEFIDPDRVKVIAIVNNTCYVIYLLQKADNNIWEIGVW